MSATYIHTTNDYSHSRRRRRTTLTVSLSGRFPAPPIPSLSLTFTITATVVALYFIVIIEPVHIYAQESRHILMHDTFDTLNRAMWESRDAQFFVGNPGNWYAATDPADASNTAVYQSAQTRADFRSIKERGAFLIYKNGYAWTDYILEYRFLGQDDDLQGAAFRYSNQSSYYHFQWQAELAAPPTRRIKRVNSTLYQAIALQDGIGVEYDIGTWYDIKLQVTGDTIAAFYKMHIESEYTQWTSVTDTYPQTPQGSIALTTTSQLGGFFDDVSVYNTISDPSAFAPSASEFVQCSTTPFALQRNESISHRVTVPAAAIGYFGIWNDVMLSVGIWFSNSQGICAPLTQVIRSDNAPFPSTSNVVMSRSASDMMAAENGAVSFFGSSELLAGSYSIWTRPGDACIHTQVNYCYSVVGAGPAQTVSLSHAKHSEISQGRWQLLKWVSDTHYSGVHILVQPAEGATFPSASAMHVFGRRGIVPMVQASGDAGTDTMRVDTLDSETSAFTLKFTAVSPGDTIFVLVHLTFSSDPSDVSNQTPVPFTVLVEPNVPTVTSVQPSLLPTAGGTQITVRGLNLASEQLFPSNTSISFNSTASDSVHSGLLEECVLVSNPQSFVDASAPDQEQQMECLSPAGEGRNVHVVAKHLARESANGRSVRIDYEAPRIDSVNPANGPTSPNGLVKLTIVGQNFGRLLAQRFVYVNQRSCDIDATHPDVQGSNAHSKIVCTLPSGAGSYVPLTMNVSSQYASSPTFFSYDAPTVVPSVLPIPARPQGGTIITVYGNNFGTYQQDVYILLGSGNVECPVQSLDTTNSAAVGGEFVTCTVPAATDSHSGNVSVSLFVGERRAQQSIMIHYMAPTVRSISPANGPAKGGTLVTITGDAFGSSLGQTVPAIVEFVETQSSSSSSSKLCSIQTHTNHRITCTSPPGSGRNQRVELTINSRPAFNSTLFSYDAPILDRVEPTIGVTNGFTVTLVGENFGPSVVVGAGATGPDIVMNSSSQACNTLFANNTVVRCALNAGTPGSAFTIKVCTRDSIGQRCSQPQTLTYAEPEIDTVLPIAGPTNGTLITLTGRNFGASQAIGQAALLQLKLAGKPVTAISSWTHTTIVATAPAGVGINLQWSLKPDLAAVDKFTYLPPTIVSMLPTIVSANPDGQVLFIAGRNFGQDPAAITVTIGPNSNCPVSYAMHTSVACTLPPLDADSPRQNLPIAIAVGGQVYNSSGTSVALSYTMPTVDTIQPPIISVPRTPGSSAIILTIKGSSFGQSGSVVVDQQVCTVSSFTDAEIRCIIDTVAAKQHAIVQITTADGARASGNLTLQCKPGHFIDSNLTCSSCSRGFASSAIDASSCTQCPHGYVAPNASATTCEACTPGQFAANSTFCQPCSKGTFSAGSAAQTCTACTNGSVAITESATSCTPCGAGTYAAISTQACVPCLPGTYASGSANTECLPCDDGLVSTSSSSSSCNICTAGRYAVNSSTPCMPCSRGSYTASPGATECITCAPGTSAPNQESTSCTPCGAGTYTANSAQACVPCLPGTFASGSANTECLPCDDGLVSTSSSSSSCNICTAGRYAVNSSTPCMPCSPGSYTASPGATECITCPPGTSAPSPESSSCTPCGAGTYAASTTATCSACPIGAYSSGTANIACTACASGFIAPNASSSSCVACSPGRFSFNASTTCQSCPAGRYAESPGQSSCVDCPVGTVAEHILATSCLPCGAGLFAASANKSCQSCEPGTFSSGSTNAQCRVCAPGTTAVLSQATICHSCSAGTYAMSATESCRVCQPGTFSSGRANTECSPCRNGSVAISPSSAACVMCAAGRFAVNSSLPCQACDAGKYAPVSGQSSCLPCGAGTSAPSQASKACTSCGAGTFAPSSTEPCQMCMPGTYAAGTSNQACTPCESGFVAPDSNMAQCTACSAGKFADSATKECVLCSIGEYSSSLASTSCSVCAAGSVAASQGMATCTDCGPGLYAFPNGARCGNCTAGFYSSGSRNDRCSLCPDGTVSPAAGQSNCISCTAGYAATDATKPCEVCAAGKFSAVPRSTACIECSPGYVATTRGATTCDACAIGKYANSTTTCAECPEGTYSSLAGATSCGGCPEGTVSFDSVTCSVCPSGTYLSEDGNSCIECENGISCTSSGLTYETITVSSGFWRSSNSSLSVTRCVIPSTCENGGCKGHRTGALCASCEDGYYATAGGLCEECPSQVASVFIFFGVVAMWLILLWIAIVIVLNSGQYILLQIFKDELRHVQRDRQYRQLFHQAPASPNADDVKDNDMMAVEEEDLGPSDLQPGALSHRSSSSADATNGRCPLPDDWRYLVECAVQYECHSHAPTAGSDSGVTESGTVSGHSIVADNGHDYSSTPSHQGEKYHLDSRTLHHVPTSAVVQMGLYDTMTWGSNSAVTVPANTGTIATISTTGTTATTAAAGDTHGNHAGSDANEYDYNSTGSDAGNDPSTTTAAAPGPGTVNIQRMPSMSSISISDSIMASGGTFRFHSHGTNNQGTSSVPLSAVFLQRNGMPLTTSSSQDDMAAIMQAYHSGDNSIATPPQSTSHFEDSKHRMDHSASEPATPSPGPAKHVGTVTDANNDIAIAPTLYATESNIAQFTHGAVPEPPATFVFQLKIAIGFFQILSSLASGIDIAWPSTFKLFALWFDAINFDFVLRHITTCGSTDFYGRTLLVVVSPLAMLLVLVILLAPRVLCCQMPLANRLNVYKVALFFIFLIYPVASSTILRVYACRELDGTSFSLVDLSQRCGTDEYDRFEYINLVFVILYPLGVPLACFLLLWWSRQTLHMKTVQAKFFILCGAYSRDFWYWDMLDMLVKLLVMAVSALLPAESQVPLSLAVIGTYAILVLVFRPFLRQRDDRLQLLSLSTLMVLLIGAYVLRDAVDIDSGLAWFALLIPTLSFIFTFLSYGAGHAWNSSIRYRRRRDIRRVQNKLHDLKSPHRTRRAQSDSVVAASSDLNSMSGVDYDKSLSHAEPLSIELAAVQYNNSEGN
jgi:IPT/TIG domain/Tyrosine-protein kinase ephrin type A/B receptor-like